MTTTIGWMRNRIKYLEECLANLEDDKEALEDQVYQLQRKIYFLEQGIRKEDMERYINYKINNQPIKLL